MRIVYATDLSPEALAGAYMGFSLARHIQDGGTDVEFDILHVIEESGISGQLLGGGDIDTQSMEKSLRKWVDENIEEPVDFGLTVLQGKPADEIREFVDENNADLLVMGQSGKGTFTRMVLGSTAHNIAQRPPCEILFAHREFTTFGQPRRFVVATDFSEASGRALRETAALAQQMNAEVDVVHVFEVPKQPTFPGGIAGYQLPTEEIDGYRREAEDEMSDFVDDHRDVLDGLTTRVEVLSGSPTQQLVEYAVTKSADIIGLATADDTSMGKRLSGSVASGVVRQMPTSTMLIPPAGK